MFGYSWLSSFFGVLCLLTLQRSTIVSAEAGQKCTSQQFTCKSGQCVARGLLCNGRKDCTDGSDELHCEQCSSSRFKCDSGECIPRGWVCDGERDCKDESDEPLSCKTGKCGSNSFQCFKSKRCIPASWRCDSNNDCEDRSDEKGCPSVQCSGERFKCANGTVSCIPQWWKCDGDADCSDGSDETTCGKQVCSKSHFSCGNNRCILKQWVCDGEDDCGDSSDEKGCSSITPSKDCREGEYRCKDGQCILEQWVCDGDRDCADGSDERSDCKPKCDPSKEFQCRSGRCILRSWRCDGEEDCGDNSDEKNCERPFSCPSGQWKCIGTTRCINVSQVCDSVNDCGDNSDEGADCLAGNCEKRNCEFKCRPTPSGQAICYCMEGYRLRNDNKTCEDINECEVAGNCDQICINRPGGYKCDCAIGYIFEPPRSCRYNSSTHPEIMFADIKRIRRFDLYTGDYSDFIVNRSRAVALDFDVRKGLVYFSDVAQNRIFVTHYAGKENRTPSKPRAIVSSGLAVPDGLAVDWVANVIYFTESAAKRIDVCTVEGKFRASLLSMGLSNPRGIALDPRYGFMFFTDWGGKSRIERAYMDGSNRTVIVDSKIGWPNGITIDYVNKVLYWADAHLDFIESSNYDGSNRRRVIEGSQNVPHPFAVTLLGDYLYFTDWRKHGIVKVNKFTGGELQIIHSNLSRPMDIHVFHISRQPSSPNPCAKENGGCEHLCVIGKGANASCLCRTGYLLQTDRKHCKTVERFLIFARSWEVRGISLDPAIEHDVMTPILGLSSSVGVDFDSKAGYVYYSDVKVNEIGRSKIDSEVPPEIILSKDLQNPDGLAVDWIGRNLFWTDAKLVGGAEINVARLDGHYQRNLIKVGLGKPRAIVVHPVKGWLFYSDWLEPARIGRVNMDGTDHVILVNGTDLGWPNGLRIDYEEERLYWADAKTDRIESMNFNGSGRVVVVEDVRHPFGLALTSTHLYWTDWLDRSIRSADRSNTSKQHVMRLDYGGLMGLQIYDKKQQRGTNKCAKHDCSHLCLARPDGYSCACANNFTLSIRDNKTCIENGSLHPTEPQCSVGMFACKNGRCIRDRWLCDGDNDCGDNSDEMETTCKKVTCKPNSFQCGNNRCIPKSWLCDTDNDCADGSDERNCTVTTCRATHFSCANNKCIQLRWVCDGDNDCGDNSDEKGCANKTCSASQFTCDSGRCISNTWRCDGEIDCPDQSDEANCKVNCTALGQFQCRNGQCVSSIKVCDDRDDCGDGSDERHCGKCQNGSCGACRNDTEFTCDNKKCVPKRYVCDFYDDCGDNSDEEQNCTVTTCQSRDFKCRNGRCIPAGWKCDKENDCGDNSDEDGCATERPPKSTCPYPNQWRCDTENLVCVNWTSVCNGKPDCPKGDDEGPNCRIDDCNTKNGGCSHYCKVTPTGVLCYCPSGMQLANDSKSCDDIDECATFGACGQVCTNTKGSFKCSCNPGYELRANRKTCSAIGPKAKLFYSDRREIRSMTLQEEDADSVLTDLSNSIGIDFDWQEQMIYWSDVNTDRIERAYFNGSGREAIVKTGLIAPEGVAVDWVARNIYWTDMRQDTIEASKLDGSMRSIIIPDGHDAPRAITVDPRYGFLFWTDWGSSPRVKRADMDGTNIKELVKEKLTWPNALTVDYQNKRVYWMDARLDYLECVTYEGEDRRTILEGSSAISHPFAMTLFEDFIYFSDWTPPRVKKVNKFTGGSKSLLQQRLNKPMDLKVFHPARQPAAKNYCKKNSCSHLCVLRPKGYSCKCPFGMQLKSDNATCEALRTVLLYARRSEIRGISLDPNETVDKITPITQLTNAVAISFHHKTESIFWSDVNEDSISRIFLNGTGRKSIIPSGVPSADGLCVDWAAENLYWTDTGKDRIEVCRLDGRYRKVIVSKDLDQPRAIVVFPQKGKLFWSDWGRKAKIEVSKLNGEGRELFLGNLGFPNGLALDYKDEVLYWCDARRDVIESINIDGTGRRVLISKPYLSHPFGIAVHGDYVYWTDWGERAISRINKNGTNHIKMRTQLLSLMGIEIYDGEREKEGNNCSKNNGGCSHLCFYMGNSQVSCGCATGFILGHDNKTCVGTETFLLYSTTKEIHGIPLDPKDESESIVPILGLRSSYAVDYNYDTAELFFVDETDDKIYRVKTDGSNFHPIITTGLDRAQGIAVDWVASNLYWTDAGTNLIEVSRFDGSNRLVLINSELSSPRCIVVYPSKGIMFWTDWGSKQPKIERASMDGSNRKVIVSSLNYTKIGWPNGLTIDFDDDNIYWVDAKSDEIIRMDLNGGNIHALKSNRPPKHPYAITVFKNYLYWTDWNLRVIARTQKDDPSQYIFMRDKIANLRDVHVFDKGRQTGNNTCGVNNGNCEQLCLAISGTRHRCACTTGKLAANGRECSLTGDFIFFAKRNEIITLYLDPRLRGAPHPPIKALNNAIGVDFDYKTSRIFYSDIFTNQIGSIFVNGSGQTVLASGLRTPDGIAFDWINQNLYWTDAQENTISRLRPNGTKEILIKENLDEPRAIALSPCDGLMYWTDWGRRPYIMRATMEGVRPKVVIDTGLGWPNGLTIDYDENKLYWADARVDRIEMSNLDGTGRRVIVSNLPHVFGVSLYGDYIYWTDWVARSVMRAEKFNGGNPVSMMSGLDAQPMDIKVFASGRQNCSKTPCYDNGGCSHICQAVDGQKKCSCPDNLKLVDGYRCVPATSNCKDTQFTCDDGTCKHKSYVCDGDKDCADESDESLLLCSHHVCPVHRTACKSSGRCIPKQWLCDHEADCDDQSDEENCSHPTCSPTEFKCRNGRCIQQGFLCDGDNDCRDFSDEKGCPVTTCRPLAFKCMNTSTCIRENWVCDGEDDCGDNSDERPEICKNITCPPGKFACANGRCIPSRWQCDKDNDCGDNSDEPSSCESVNRTCLPSQFKCDNGSCVSKRFICDGDRDCIDGTDEDSTIHKCEKRTCHPTDFTCKNSSRCIPMSYKCDGDNDCGDGSDEHPREGCPARRCASHEFRCDNGICIRSVWNCDQEDDCGDGSDEDDCKNGTCAQNQFACRNGQCIAANMKCDGQKDCIDGSDETLCTSPTPTTRCGPGNFSCGLITQNDTKCIFESQVCDRRMDCDDGSDEKGCHVNECADVRLHGCTQICIDRRRGFSCACHQGYKLLPDKKTCTDIDECAEYPLNNCSQFCMNLPGSFKCYCTDGYSWESQSKTCKPTRDLGMPYLLFSNRHYIKTLTLDNKIYDVVQRDRRDAYAVDFDWKEQKYYWTDRIPGEVRRASFIGNFSSDIVARTGLPSPFSLAVDWVGRNLYFTDRVRDSLYVCKLNGDYRKTLMTDPVHRPMAIAVYPMGGWLYYTVWGRNASISRVGMDGTKKQRVITEKIAWPKGIAVDYVTQKVYWTDAHLQRIELANLDGSGRRVLLTAMESHLFDITIFGDYVYWTEWMSSTVNKAHRFSGLQKTALRRSSYKTMGITVVHPLRQPNVSSPCDANNGGCSNLCLLSPGGGYQCDCPDNFHLANDKKKCLSNCTAGQFECKSYKCIPLLWRCDAEDDCGDKSDEDESCPDRKCRPGQLQCKNSNCTSPFWICDGEDDCGDKSDEQNCDARQCFSFQFRCADHTCIFANRVCNGQDDCKDGSDEWNCTKKETSCPPNHFRCKSGRCISSYWKCDGDNDCSDNSDESEEFCSNRTCRPDHFKCNNSRCISKRYVCDGDNDCQDGSDESEAQCASHTCSVRHFTCRNNRCIPKRWKCDFDNDCGDNSDEDQCLPKRCNNTKEFTCDNGRCINRRWQCDQDDDCGDNSDETNCKNVTCSADHFTCSSGHCIRKLWRCDGEPDCKDGSDEKGCDSKSVVCGSDEFKCNNNLCIKRSWVCDGDNDCLDGSDEFPGKCSSGAWCDARTQFSCKNGYCIRKWKQCDGVENCADGSDEEDCNKCSSDQFKCDNTTCIEPQKVCNGIADCPGKQDEIGCGGRGVNSCQKLNGGCQQYCEQLERGHICKCKAGFQVDDTMAGCEDIDECKQYGTCSQHCENVVGTYKCHCAEGYVPAGSRGSCRAEGSPVVLILPIDGQIRKYDPRGKGEFDTFMTLNGTVDTLNFHVAKGLLFFGDRSKSQITAYRFRAEALTETTRRRRLSEPVFTAIKVNFDDVKPKSIAIDWVGNNVYWINSDPKNVTIMIADLEGKGKKVLIQKNLYMAESIVLEPEKGYIYWTSGGANPAIWRARMDGTEKMKFVSDRLEWPTKLAIDIPGQRLYWSDTKQRVVESVGLDGSHRRVVLASWKNPEMDHPYSIDVFEDDLYVLTWRTGKLLRAHKYGKDKIKVIARGLKKTSTVKFYQENRQMLSDKFKNPCAFNPCEELCVVIDGNKRCVCSAAKLQSNGECITVNKTCENSFCNNQGSCIQIGHEKQCRCHGNFTGVHCETSLDKCRDFCQHDGICSFEDGNPTCKCKEGYTGSQCEIKDPCKNFCRRGDCKYIGGKAYCSCPRGYTGRRCEAPFCAEDTCSAGRNCTIFRGHTLCKCTNGEVAGVDSDDTCRDLCQLGDIIKCKANHRCVIGEGDQELCSCKEGFKGVNCDEATCETFKCPENADCVVVNGKHVCSCRAGFTKSEGGACVSLCSATSRICPQGYECRVSNESKTYCVCVGNCRTTKTIQTKKNSRTVAIAVPIILVLILACLVVLFVVCKRRGRFTFKPSKPLNIHVGNPTFNYEGLKEEEAFHENEGFLTEMKPSNFTNPIYNDMYDTRTSLRSTSTEDSTDPEHPLFEDFSEKRKLVAD